MRKCLTIILFISICQTSFCQEKNNFSNHQLSVDFGSFRNQYLYPITDVKYSSPVLKKVNLKFSATLRSYGTLYFYSKSSYDVTPFAEYYFTKTIKPVYFSVGIGLDTRIRLVRDARSDAKSSAEPLVTLMFYCNYQKLFFNTLLRTRFYSNGISLSLLPEASYQIGKIFSIFLRYELNYLAVYNVSTHEWQQDSVIGTQVLF